MEPDLFIGSINRIEPTHIKAELSFHQREYHIYFKSNELSLYPTVDSIIPFSLLPMMVIGGNVVTNNPISEKMFHSLPVIQDIFATWLPEIHRIDFPNIPTQSRKPAPSKTRVGAFFSAGVDAWYTLLKHRDEITDIIFVHGFDIALDDDRLHDEVYSVIQSIGESLGKNVIEVKTNLRSFTNGKTNWHYTFGSGLASVGHALQEHFEKIYIPSTHTYADLYPAGSHPVLDHLWNSETLSFIHDGCEAGRVEKLRLIAQHKIALESLRVCWKNRYGPYNCGKCEKCIRTMISLQAIGALENCITFQQPISLKTVKKLLVTDEGMAAYTQENLAALRNNPANRKLYNALNSAARASRWKVPLLERYGRFRRSFRSKFPNLADLLHLIRHLGKDHKHSGWQQ